jgi:hypothetical protein
VFFRESIFKTDCDRCGARFDPIQGGVCAQCRRILCGEHLHGSRWQRLRTQVFGAPTVCIYCRAEAGQAPEARAS